MTSIGGTATWVLGVALGLGSVSCGSKDDGSTATAPDDDGADDMGGSYYAGPSTDTFDPDTGSSTTMIEPDTTTDMGGSYYAGPTSSTTWEESSSSSSGTTMGESDDSTDTGGSYYAGPPSSTGVWDEDPEKPA